MRVLIISLEKTLQRNGVTPLKLIYPVGVFYIAKQIEKYHKVKIFTFETDVFDKLKKVISDFKPNLILISIRHYMDIIQYNQIKEEIEYIKSLNIKFIIGGKAVSYIDKKLINIHKHLRALKKNFTENSNEIFQKFFLI